MLENLSKKLFKQGIGVVAAIDIDKTNPNRAYVVVDKGKKPDSDAGQELTSIIVKTRRLVQERWSRHDVVYIGWLGIIKKIASKEELQDLGFDTDKFYGEFGDWENFFSNLSKRQASH
jgi:hypothetical protein